MLHVKHKKENEAKKLKCFLGNKTVEKKEMLHVKHKKRERS